MTDQAHLTETPTLDETPEMQELLPWQQSFEPTDDIESNMPILHENENPSEIPVFLPVATANVSLMVSPAEFQDSSFSFNPASIPELNRVESIPEALESAGDSLEVAPRESVEDSLQADQPESIENNLEDESLGATGLIQSNLARLHVTTSNFNQTSQASLQTEMKKPLPLSIENTKISSNPRNAVLEDALRSVLASALVAEPRSESVQTASLNISQKATLALQISGMVPSSVQIIATVLDSERENMVPLPVCPQFGNELVETLRRSNSDIERINTNVEIPSEFINTIVDSNAPQIAQFGNVSSTQSVRLSNTRDNRGGTSSTNMVSRSRPLATSPIIQRGGPGRIGSEGQDDGPTSNTAISSSVHTSALRRTSSSSVSPFEGMDEGVSIFSGFTLNRQSSVESISALQAVESRSATVAEALQVLSRATEKELPKFVTKFLKTINNKQKNEFLENGVKLLDEMPQIYQQVHNSTNFIIVSEIKQQITQLTDPDANKVKLHIQKYGAKDKNGKQTLVGIVSTITGLKDFLKNVNSNSNLKQFKQGENVASGRQYTKDHLSNVTTRAIMFPWSFTLRDSDPDLNIGAVLYKDGNRVNDLVFPSTRNGTSSSYAALYRISAQDLNNSQNSRLIKYRIDNLHQRIETDAFRWSLVIHFNVDECVRIVTQLCKAQEYDCYHMKLWMTKISGFHNIDELGVPAYELLHAFSRMDVTFKSSLIKLTKISTSDTMSKNLENFLQKLREFIVDIIYFKSLLNKVIEVKYSSVLDTVRQPTEYIEKEFQTALSIYKIRARAELAEAVYSSSLDIAGKRRN